MEHGGDFTSRFEGKLHGSLAQQPEIRNTMKETEKEWGRRQRGQLFEAGLGWGFLDARQKNPLLQKERNEELRQPRMHPFVGRVLTKAVAAMRMKKSVGHGCSK
jgi:hypothetical protein